MTELSQILEHPALGPLKALGGFADDIGGVFLREWRKRHALAAGAADSDPSKQATYLSGDEHRRASEGLAADMGLNLRGPKSQTWLRSLTGDDDQIDDNTWERVFNQLVNVDKALHRVNGVPQVAVGMRLTDYLRSRFDWHVDPEQAPKVACVHWLFEGLAETDDLEKSAARKDRPMGDLDQLATGNDVDYMLQEHLANIAGPHHDLRLGTPETNLFSWAVRRGMPGVGEKRIAVRQPLHHHRILGFSGEIPRGRFGGGKITTVDQGKAKVTKDGDDLLVHTATQGFRLSPKGGTWLISRTGG